MQDGRIRRLNTSRIKLDSTALSSSRVRLSRGLAGCDDTKEIKAISSKLSKIIVSTAQQIETLFWNVNVKFKIDINKDFEIEGKK